MKDIAKNEEGYIFENGDFVVIDSENQHLVDLLNLNKGSNRYNPIAGCNLKDFQKFNGNYEAIRLRLEEQLKLDGFVLTVFVVNSDEELILECKPI